MVLQCSGQRRKTDGVLDMRPDWPLQRSAMWLDRPDAAEDRDSGGLVELASATFGRPGGAAPAISQRTSIG